MCVPCFSYKVFQAVLCACLSKGWGCNSVVDWECKYSSMMLQPEHTVLSRNVSA